MVDLSNALAGAGTGAGVGAAFGPLGAGIGGLVGGLGGLFGGGKGKKDKIKNLPNYTPEQQQFINQRLQMAMQGDQEAMKFIMSILSDEPGAFEDFERGALEQFNEQVIPGIMERFSGLGAQSSSALNQSLSQAARRLSGDLASQRASLKGQAINQLNNYANTGLTRQNSPYVQQGNQGLFNQLAPAAAQGWQSLVNRYQGGL